jgi:galactonate dehydratase
MAPHNPNGPVATLMNLQFAASIPNFYLLETIGSEADWKLWAELLRNSIKLEDGCLPVPIEPGYGIEWNEEAAARHPYLPHDGWR